MTAATQAAITLAAALPVRASYLAALPPEIARAAQMLQIDVAGLMP